MLSLPHILLNRIILNIQENIDRVSLILTCKKLYEERDKFLRFLIETNNHTLNIIPSKNHPKLLILPISFKYNLILEKNNLKIEDKYYEFIDESYLKFNGGFFDTSLYNESISTLEFGNIFISPLCKSYIPRGLKKLIFGENFNQRIYPKTLPDTLEYLKFGYRWNQELKQHIFPKNLKTLIFGDSFNQQIRKGVIPTTIEYLSFGYRFNKPIFVDALPQSISHLEFGYKFNQLFVLPRNLETLRISSDYSHNLSFSSLQSIKHLIITISIEAITRFLLLQNVQIDNLSNIQTITFQINNHNLVQIRKLSKDDFFLISKNLKGGFISNSNLTKEWINDTISLLIKDC